MFAIWVKFWFISMGDPLSETRYIVEVWSGVSSKLKVGQGIVLFIHPAEVSGDRFGKVVHIHDFIDALGLLLESCDANTRTVAREIK